MAKHLKSSGAETRRCLIIFFLVCIGLLCSAPESFSQQSGTITYTYDKLNRLTGVAYSSGGAIIYAYDAAGNRTSIQVTGGTSNPTIISLNPNNANASGGAFTLTVNGSNFVTNSIVQWNGANRATTFLGPAQLSASILVSDLVAPAVANITVLNPGNLASNAVAFTINSLPPPTRTLTIASSNPSSGVSINLNPTDNNGATSGTTQFTRVYNHNTIVTLNAPPSAAATNFMKWQRNGQDWSFNQSTNVTLDANYTLTAVYVPPPTIFTEVGTNDAIALDSVTRVRGPFNLVNPFNLSNDQRTRVMIFTSDVGLVQPNSSILSVQAAGMLLPVENVGALTGVPGLNSSFIIVRLPDGLPSGSLQLTITLRGITSNLTRLHIAP